MFTNTIHDKSCMAYQYKPYYMVILSTSWPNEGILHHLGVGQKTFFSLRQDPPTPPTRGSGFPFRHPLESSCIGLPVY
jgi:hypothetical protein